jgi:hypothetical protein
MNKHKSTRLLLLLLLPAFLVSFSGTPYKANFSGTWKLNESKSDLGEFGGRFAARKFKVEQKEDGITISRTGTNFQGEEYTTTENLSFDGKVNEMTVFETSKKKSSIKWSDDGNSFTITYTMEFNFNGESSVANGTEKWTLSEDGKMLTSQINSTSPRGEFAMKGAYDKE